MPRNPIDLGDGSQATVEFLYGTQKMEHLRKAPDQPHRTTKAIITILKGEAEVGKIEGVSYCSPHDQFDKVKGRRLALQRAFAEGRKDARGPLAPKVARERIARAIIVPAAVKQSRRK